jgi:hypothetical protein
MKTIFQIGRISALCVAVFIYNKTDWRNEHKILEAILSLAD